jgi:hypothetical protein
LEAMMLSDPTDCTMHNATCLSHLPRCMLQIFSLKLAKILVDAGSVELYGYIAARDDLEPLLNYVINVSRDAPIIVQEVRIYTYLQLFQGISLASRPNCGGFVYYPLKYKTRYSNPLTYSIQSNHLLGQFWRWLGPATILLAMRAKPPPKLSQGII